MKLKKIITSMPLLCTALSATLGAVGGYAGTMGNEGGWGSPFKGWYLGAEGGILNTVNDIKQNVLYPLNFGYALFNKNYQTNLTQTNKYGTGFFSLGLGDVYFNKLYFGAEAGVSIANKVSNHSDNNIYNNTLYDQSLTTVKNYIQTKLNYAEFDFDFKAGALLSDLTLLYARLGIAFNHNYNTNYLRIDNVSSTLQTDYSITPPTDVITFPYGYGSAGSYTGKNVLGLRLGVGIEHSIAQYFSLKLDYIATWYQSSDSSAYGNIYWDPNSYIQGYQPSPLLPFDNNSIRTSLTSGFITHAVMLGVNIYLDDMFSL